MEKCAGGAEITVDLERQVVVDPDGRELPFEIDAFSRQCLLDGLDEIALTLRRAGEIDRVRAGRRRSRRHAVALTPAGYEPKTRSCRTRPRHSASAPRVSTSSGCPASTASKR